MEGAAEDVMAQCSRCGQELAEETRFCPSCGTAVTEGGTFSEPSDGSTAPSDPNGSAVGTPLPMDLRNMAMLCHLSSFAGVLIPFANIFGPLLVWLLKREQSPFINDHGMEALNWQISATIYLIASALMVLLVVGIVLLPIVFVFNLVVVIIATVRASNGEPYRYPLCIRFIRP